MLAKNFLSRRLRARPRLTASVVVAIVVALCLPARIDGLQSTRLLVAWNAGACLFLVLTARMFALSTSAKLLKRARLEDEGAWVVLVLVIVAAVASLVAIVAELAGVKGMASDVKVAHVALVGLTVLSSWAFTHTMFAMHYAHNYYLGSAGKGGNGGLLFPSAAGSPPDEPDYLDFLYFSFVIGTSAQTADVSFTGKQMRRLGTVHCVLSFVFNTSILALCINIGAGLV